MTRYGFLIDQDSCVGCHACTVACKAEHDVPLGVNRTWVKYIERGTFPDARRHFAVLRCNHCEDAPCVTICPTTALFHRDDGIVDFDDSACIGCKSCMNACPYDALFINPETGTAHKCNFCAHRVEIGLEPSCVIVCPTQAIVAGDLDDPTARISLMLGRSDTKVRAPEQGTRPKVFYRGADEASLDPLRTRIADDGLIWSDTLPDHPTPPPGAGGIGGAGDQVVARTAYTTRHASTWGTKVTAYLATKSVSAGALLVGALAVLTGHGGQRGFVGIALPLLALVMAAVTGALLVADLRQPSRFHYLFTRPQWGSWLVRGAFILAAYGVAGLIWLVGGLAGSSALVTVVAIPAAVLAVATAAYTGFLLAQCEGRDLWQSPLVTPVLVAQAVLGGGAGALLLAPFFDLPDGLTTALRWSLLGGVVAVAVLVAIELTSRGSVHVELAQQAMTRGAQRSRFVVWVVLGVVAAAALSLAGLLADAPALDVLAAVAALAGLVAYEDAFIRAGQSVPLS